MTSFKMMKVFDCQDMPEDLRHNFFKFFDDGQAGNSCYVDWYIQSERYEDPLGDWDKRKIAIDSWLIENGAKPAKSDNHEGEHVLVRYWW
jgi:hypothetical protein